MTLSRFGATLLYLLTTSPTMIGRSSRRHLAAKLDGNSTQSTDSKGDLLPLPLPFLATAEQQERQFLEGDASSEDLKNIDEEVAAHCWETCVTLVMNHWHLSPQSEAGRGREKLPMHHMDELDAYNNQMYSASRPGAHWPRCQ